MIKRNPTYRLTVYPTQKEQNIEPLIIEYPITCRFNSARGLFSQANRCTIELVNLSESSRSRIFQAPYTQSESEWKFAKLEAGWNGVLSQIFYGKILQAYSHKIGGHGDIITKIECLPFDIFSSQSAHTFEAGTSYRTAYKTMAGDLKGCQIGNIGSLNGTFKTQTTFEGNTHDCLNELTGGHTFVDNGIVNTIMANEVIDVPIPLITGDNELLETPLRRNMKVTIKMLFEPTLIVGQFLEFKSNVQTEYNGQYKVIGFTHDCVISPTEAGQRITTITMNVLNTLPRAAINLTNEQISGDSDTVNAYKVNGEEVTPITPVNIVNSWIMPCVGRISSYFGARTAPTANASTYHKGIDIAAKTGTPVHAPQAGTVYFASYEGANGNCVRLNHGTVNGKKLTSTSIHLSTINVKNGQTVKQGDQIGTVGSTGRYPDGKPSSTGPHLHISVYENGTAVNPLKYIDKSKFA